MSRRKHEANSPFVRNSEDSPRQKKRVRKRKILPIVVLLALFSFVFFLPTIIVSTSLKDRAIAYAIGDFDGRVTIESASLGWFSPIQIRGVELRHQGDDPLISIASIASRKPLIKFLTGGTAYGEFEILEPEFNITLDENGSNLERAVNALVAAQHRHDDDSGSLPEITIKCINGKANIHSLATRESWNLDSLNLLVKTATDDIPLAFEGDCRFVSNGNPTGQFAFSSEFDGGAEQLTFGSVQLAISAQNLPLALTAPIAQRFAGPTTTTGFVTGELQLAYDANTTQVALSVDQLQLTKAGITAPKLLGSDRIFSESLIARGKINLSPRQISASEFEVDSDIGKFNANGVFETDQLNNLVASGEMLNTPFSVSGKIDLARLANMIPHTLRLYEDLQFQSGIVSFQASSVQQDDNHPRRLVVNIDSANIRARRGGKDIVWQMPVRLVGTLNQSVGKLVFEEMRVHSDFLTIQGAGSYEGGNLEIEGDLSKLVERFSQFADLGALQLAGIINGHIDWKLTNVAANSSSTTHRPFQLEGHFDVTNAAVTWPGLTPWRTAQLSAKLQGTGHSDQDRLRIDYGSLDVLVGTEKLVAALSQPIADFWSQDGWNLQCQLTGDLTRWIEHVKGYVDIGDLSGSGNLGLSCAAHVDSKFLRLDEVRFLIKKFGFEGYSLRMDQPEVEGKTNLHYDFQSGQIVLDDFSTAGRSFSLSAQQLKILPTDPMLLDGILLFQADVNRVAAWYGYSTKPTDIHWYGTAQGTVSFDSATKGIGGNAEVRISDLVAAYQVSELTQSTPTRLVSQPKVVWKELWREPSVETVSDFLVGRDYDSVQLKNLRLNATSLRLAGQGTVNQVTGAMITDFKGNWNPKWQLVNAMLKPSIGNLIVISGNQPQPITIQGPIFAPAGTQNGYWISPQLRIQTAIGWNKADIMKLPFGGNQFAVDLNQSLVAMEMGEIPLGQGVLRLAPRLDLRSETIWLSLPPGTIADQVELTPDTCRRWLKFVAPLAADATSAKGKFSVSTTGIRLPVMNPTAVEGQGLIRLSDVTIGAGPIAQELLASANQIRTILKPDAAPLTGDSAWLKMAQQEVPIAIQNGRVFHDGLTIAHRDLQIRTKGSVGIDQTINMVAEIPILDRWISGEKWLEGLKGQSISIPISGTLSTPRLDQRAISQLSQQLIRNAAGNALNKAVEDKLGAGQRVINDRLNREIERANEKINEKLPDNVGEKLENEMLRGLNNLLKKGGGN